MKEVRSQKCFQLRDICKSEVCEVLSFQCTKVSMHIETVLTINSQDIHSDFHTSVLSVSYTTTQANLCKCRHMLARQSYLYKIIHIHLRSKGLLFR